ncbi:MAG: hypothetical protein H0X24_11835 [Ktedonobacterales bacterium]|nr:hypothetical protein [Ktedonobacterales bacterium]
MSGKTPTLRLIAQWSIIKTKRPVYVFSDGTIEHRITKPRDVWRCTCTRGKYFCDALVLLFAYLRQRTPAEIAAEAARDAEREHTRTTAIILRQDNTGPRWLR